MSTLEPTSTRVALLATATFVVGAVVGIGSYFVASEPSREVEMLQHENRLLEKKIELLEAELEEINAVLRQSESIKARLPEVPADLPESEEHEIIDDPTIP